MLSEPRVERTHEFTDYLKCPYCDHDHGDCHEISGYDFSGEGKTECEACGKTFFYSFGTDTYWHSGKEL